MVGMAPSTLVRPFSLLRRVDTWQARPAWHKGRRPGQHKGHRMTDEFEGLLARVAGGDRSAFERLYRDASPLLLGICLRVLPDRMEAEDVLQDVFVTIWHKSAQFDARRAKAVTWMGAIARHRAIDRLRATPVTLHAMIDAELHATDPEASPEVQATTQSTRARLDDCVELLEPKRRHLIRTAFFEGVTYEALAARIEAPLGSVKSWIRRSLQQLRECLEA
jgi:RNA polymerase sigma-70 factor (ECF subfamily)